METEKAGVGIVAVDIIAVGVIIVAEAIGMGVIVVVDIITTTGVDIGIGIGVTGVVTMEAIMAILLTPPIVIRRLILTIVTILARTTITAAHMGIAVTIVGIKSPFSKGRQVKPIQTDRLFIVKVNS